MKKPLHFRSVSIIEGWTDVDVDVLLHRRGSDFTIYRNEYATRGASVVGERDSLLLCSIVYDLMADEKAGVESVSFENYSIKVRHSPVVPTGYVNQIIEDSCRREGYVPIEGMRDLDSFYRGLRVSELDSPGVIARVLWRSIAARAKSFLSQLWDDLQSHASYLTRNPRPRRKL